MNRIFQRGASAFSTGRHCASARRFALAAAAGWITTATLLAASAAANTITVRAAAPDRSAAAAFSLAGQTLEITLSNTYSDGPTFQFAPTDVLTGLFFDIAGMPVLTAVRAMLPSESAIRLNGADITASETGGQPFGVGDVGAAWAYKTGAMSGLSQQYGLTSVGFSIIGPHDLFHPGSKLAHQQGAAPSGDDYGLMPLVTSNYTHSNLDDRAFVQGSITFTLSGFTGSLDDIGNVRFQYGSALTSPSLESVPEPSTWAILMVGAVGILGFARRSQG